MKRYLLWILIFSWACQPNHSNQQNETESIHLKAGQWRGILNLQGQQAPFQFELLQKDNDYIAYLQNGEERLLLDEINIAGDSIHITLHIFGAELAAKIIDEGSIEGKWIKYGYQEPYEVTFQAKQGLDYRFQPSKANVVFEGKWQTIFKEDDGKTYPAIGVFEQKDDLVTGTFLTTTGDYRYLQGNVKEDTLQLSTFDGSHGFLFKAFLDGDTLRGEFWSGKSSYETFSAYQDDKASLPDAEELTYLKEGEDEIYFTFPNIQGDTVHFPSEKYKDKVVLVQVMGSWCPNCMDETAFYMPYYQKNKEQGLEIIALAYERSPDFAKAKTRVEKMIDKYGIEYEVLVAGINDKAKTSETLPMLNEIISYPTTIYIDRKGKVRKIHTGFTGPGTGTYYEKFTNEFYQFMEELLKEKS